MRIHSDTNLKMFCVLVYTLLKNYFHINLVFMFLFLIHTWWFFRGLLLALYSGITPGDAQMTIWNTKFETELSVYKARAILTVLSLQTINLVF